MVNTSGLARCPFVLGSIRFCRFSFSLFPSPFSTFTEKFTFFLENGLSSNSRSTTSLARVSVCTMYVCVCVCLRKYTYATTSVTSKHNCWHKAEGELVRANVKWPTFLAFRELDSFHTFCSPSLVPPFNPDLSALSLSLPPLFLPQLSPATFSPSPSVCQTETRKAARFTRGFSRGIQTKINRTTKGRLAQARGSL